MLLKEDKNKQSGHDCPVDPLEDIEEELGHELSGKMHEEAEKPTKFPKKVRDSKKESYRPMKRK